MEEIKEKKAPAKATAEKAEKTEKAVKAAPKAEKAPVEKAAAAKAPAAKAEKAEKAPAAKAEKAEKAEKAPAAKAEKPAEAKAPAAAKAKEEKKESKAPVSTRRKPRMKDYYRNEVVPALFKHFGFKNINEVPRLEKITLNMRMGDIKDNTKSMSGATDELRIISGQKPVTTKAKNSLANWKIRAGMPIGAKVTLRGDRMYDFYDKLVSIGLPRVRDFKGLSPNSFDGRGNYSLGIKEQLIFPEISYDKVEKVRGFDISITTTAKTDEHARELLKLMGLPMKSN